MSKQKLVAGGLLIGVFVSGVVVGNVSHLLADRSEAESSESRPASYVDWLEEEMTLNTQQETAIAVILEQYDSDMSELWDYVRPRSEELRREARAAIAEIMDAEQRDIYESMNHRLDSLRAERRRNRNDQE